MYVLLWAVLVCGSFQPHTLGYIALKKFEFLMNNAMLADWERHI